MNFKPDNFQTKVLSEFNQGNKEVAILKLKKYLVVNPKDINARLNLAYMYINFNLIHKAIYEYEHILKKSQNLQAMFNLAICFSRLEKVRKCENLLKKIIKIDNHLLTLVRGDRGFTSKNKSIKLDTWTRSCYRGLWWLN